MAQFPKLRTLTPLQKVLILTLVILILWMSYFSHSNHETTTIKYKPPRVPLERILRHGIEKADSIHIVISACGQNPEFLDQALVLLKSVVILTRSRVHFIIFTDYMGFQLHQAMQNWPFHIQSRFSYEIRPTDYSVISQDDQAEWKYMFKACSTQRLFVPKMFPDLDSVLYIDADTLLMDDVQNLWDHFLNFNENQIAGLAEEFYHTEEHIGFGHWKTYGENGIPPIVGLAGVNAGVILMNLTRMRNFGWEDRILPIYKEFKDHGLYADQGIINVIFHHNMDKLYPLTCRWNYWCDYCKWGICCMCDSAQDHGIGLLHHTGFKWDQGEDIHSHIFGPYLDYNFEDDLQTNLLVPVKKSLGKLKGVMTCGDDVEVLTKALETMIKQLQKND